MEELVLQLLIQTGGGGVGAMKWEGTTFKTKDLRVSRSE